MNEECLPCRQCGQRDGGGLGVGRGGRLGGEFVARHRHELGVRAVPLAVDVTEYLIPDSDARRVRPARLDDTCDLVAGDDGRRAGRAVVVEPRSAQSSSPGLMPLVHTDEDIAGPRRGTGASSTTSRDGSCRA